MERVNVGVVAMERTLRDLLDAKELTVLQVAAAMERAGSPVTTFGVQNWVDGLNVPRPVYLPALSLVLGVEKGEVLEACNASVAARKLAAVG